MTDRCHRQLHLNTGDDNGRVAVDVPLSGKRGDILFTSLTDGLIETSD